MIDLPDMPMTATPVYVDNGFLQRAAIGGETQRIERKGSRFKLAVSAGPFYPGEAGDLVADLIAGKSQGVRMAFPLYEKQGSAGTPVIDGAGQAGTTLNIKGCMPGYVCRKRFFLSIENENGRHYVHKVRATAKADASGNLVLGIEPELRHRFLDGATVHLSKPMIQGFVDGEEWAWAFSGDQTTPIQFTVEEAE